MKEVWFKRKTFVWGWVPISWQGWGILVMYIFLVASEFRLIDLNSHSASDTLQIFFPRLFIITVFLIIICYKKGETPRWQWWNKEID